MELTVPVDVNVPADVLWEVVSDLEGQSDWMLGTTVEITAGDGRSVGTRLRAVPGSGRSASPTRCGSPSGPNRLWGRRGSGGSS
ncbi:hypothetical protein [Pseudonocardia sp. ICBG601]|uniref:hypothetical protein n=1 Tax=Pseudonocardia sp. ICBG601 TaxID=2846759 RepID=UPI0027E3AF78|nr:hypothetical protein [Pseudonocardia sp. ICBG601]